MSAENTALQNIIRYCLCEHIFSYIMLISIDGYSVVGSREPSAMHGLAARLQKIVFGRTVVFELDFRNLVD
jgi:hypothetical protein